MKKFWFIIFITVLCFSSCEKDETEQVETNPYEDFLNTRVTKSIQFNNSVIITEPVDTIWNVIANSSDNLNDLNPINDIVYVNDTCIKTPEPNYVLKDNIEGKNMRISFSNDKNVTSFYIPQTFRLIYPKLTSTSDNVVNSNILFKWAPDSKNNYNLRIEVSTTPTYSGNEVSNKVYVKDDGNCYLPKELFKGIPENTEINVSIERYNFCIVKKGNDKYSIWAYSLRYFIGTYKSK